MAITGHKVFPDQKVVEVLLEGALIATMHARIIDGTPVISVLSLFVEDVSIDAVMPPPAVNIRLTPIEEIIDARPDQDAARSN
jgi:hypothetical protein